MRTIIALLSFSLAGCVTTYNGKKFSTHDGRHDQLDNIPEHGFMKPEYGNLCEGDSKVQGGYFATLREPKRGETESEFQQYVEAEKIRVSVCAKASTWCSTEAHLLCRLDDGNCVAQQSGGRRNTCKIRVIDSWDKPALRPVTTQMNQESWIECGLHDDDYTGPIARSALTERGWVKDRAKWEAFCSQQRPKEECDQILRVTETDSHFVWLDASRWAAETLIKETPKVERIGNRWFGTTELDLTPACSLLEKRY